MSYNYSIEKKDIFDEASQVDFLKVRDHVYAMLAATGACSMGKAMSHVSGSTWKTMAYVDRLVELGEIREVTSAAVAGQDRIFVSNL